MKTQVAAALLQDKQPIRNACRATGVIAGAVSCALSLATHAADWRFDPRIEVGGVYNDNFRLTSRDQIEVSGAAVDALAAIRALTPTSEFRLVPRIHSTFFPSDRDQETNDQYLNADYAYNGQKVTSNIGGSYSRLSVLTSELPSTSTTLPGLGTPLGPDTGRVSLRTRRDTLDFAPRMIVQLAPRQKLQLNAEYQNVEFSPSTSSYVDFKSYTAAVGWGYDVTPRSTMLINAVGTRFEPRTTFDQNSNTYGGRLEWWYHKSETLQGYLRGGVDRTEGLRAASTSSAESKINYVLGAGLNGVYQITSVYADASRAVTPNASGGLVIRNQLSFRVRRSLSPRYAGFLSGIVIDDSAAQKNVDFDDRRYAIGTLGVEWRFLREFSLVGQYNYRWQKYQSDPGAAHGNEVGLSIVYEPNRPADDLTRGFYHQGNPYEFL